LLYFEELCSLAHGLLKEGMSLIVLELFELLGIYLLSDGKGFLESLRLHQCHNLHSLGRVQKLATIHYSILGTDIFHFLDVFINLLDR
jgi:hypothetical protein